MADHVQDHFSRDKSQKACSSANSGNNASVPHSVSSQSISRLRNTYAYVADEQVEFYAGDTGLFVHVHVLPTGIPSLFGGEYIWAAALLF